MVYASTALMSSALLAMCLLAVRSLLKTKVQGGCGGCSNCDGCGGGCGGHSAASPHTQGHSPA